MGIPILYVEDEANSRRVMQMIVTLMDDPPHLMLFEDSHDFVARVTALNPQPEVIFLDIHVPPHNGFEMLRQLRESGQFAGIPIIAMTASVMNEEINRLNQAGFDGCIAKPIDMDTFPQLLEKIRVGQEVWHISR